MDAGILFSGFVRPASAALATAWACISMACGLPPCGADEPATTAPVRASAGFLRATPESRDGGALDPYSFKSGLRQAGHAGPGYAEDGGRHKPDGTLPADGGLFGSTQDRPHPYVRIEQPAMRRYSGVKKEKQLGPDVTVYGYTERSDEAHEPADSRRDSVGGGVRVKW